VTPEMAGGTSSPSSGCDLAALGRAGGRSAMLESIGDRPAARSAGRPEPGSAGPGFRRVPDAPDRASERARSGHQPSTLGGDEGLPGDAVLLVAPPRGERPR